MRASMTSAILVWIGPLSPAGSLDEPPSARSLPLPVQSQGQRWAGVLPRALLLSLLVALPGPSWCQAQTAELYDSAGVAANGVLSIRTADHRSIVPTSDSGQVWIDQVAISPDRHAVGWLVMHPNCCTSYPIPLALKVYAGGILHSFTGIDLPVWRWRFEGGGAQVSLYQETVHGGMGTHYELRDVMSGRLLAQYEPTDSTPAPPWVTRLSAYRPDSLP
jgi:hypothetical protein